MSETPTHTALRPTASGRLQAWLPRLVLAPSVAVSLFFVYGFMLWTFVLSLTSSRMLPSYDFVGFGQYARLMANERWWVASTNLMIFGTLFIVICLVLGALLAMLLDQKMILIQAGGKCRRIGRRPNFALFRHRAVALLNVSTQLVQQKLVASSRTLRHLLQAFRINKMKLYW